VSPQAEHAAALGESLKFEKDAYLPSGSGPDTDVATAIRLTRKKHTLEGCRHRACGVVYGLLSA
jgi:hypothetical protein